MIVLPIGTPSAPSPAVPTHKFLPVLTVGQGKEATPQGPDTGNAKMGFSARYILVDLSCLVYAFTTLRKAQYENTHRFMPQTHRQESGGCPHFAKTTHLCENDWKLSPAYSITGYPRDMQHFKGSSLTFSNIDPTFAVTSKTDISPSAILQLNRNAVTRVALLNLLVRPTDRQRILRDRPFPKLGCSGDTGGGSCSNFLPGGLKDNG